MSECKDAIECDVRTKKAELFDLIEQQAFHGAEHQKLAQAIQKLHQELNALRQQNVNPAIKAGA